MIYLLDTNTISDVIDLNANVRENLRIHRSEGHELVICQPVYFELQKGLLSKDKRRKLVVLRDQLLPLLRWQMLMDEDWLQAAHFWADARKTGYQISDIDVLIAAMAHRLDAVVVTSDNDFDALPIKRENWR